jgi:hypothetical protein
MSANDTSHLNSITDDLDLVLDHLRGAMVALGLIAEAAGLTDSSDTTTAFTFTTAAALAGIEQAEGLTTQLHAAHRNMRGDL